MNVRNCRKCGKIFNYAVGPIICPNCREKMEEVFQDVKKFVQDNKNVGIPEISEACEVEPAQIQQWIREERLVFADDSPIGIPCESCGCMIKAGRYCDKCKAEITKGFNPTVKREEALRPQKQSERAKMRFLDK
ncbi:MAG: flagellar protein [Lachnospiraceae bacterium]|nr:flagellar protein [Lachnospiraceae bacterium]